METPVSDLRSGPPAAAPARLLVVDDLEDNRIIIGRRFTRRGFDVTVAASGEEALALIAERAFDVVLLDIVMPGLDGFEVLSRIRADHSPLDLPVVMVTVRNNSGDIVRALQLGANDYVPKPVDFEVAVARVTAQIDRKRAVTESLAGVAPDGEMDDLRRSLARARAASQAKSDVLANMSHEIRTPLNGILGLARAISAGAAQDARHTATLIAESAASLERLLSDALDLSKAEAGKLDIRAEPIELDALLSRVAGLFAPGAEAKGLAFRLELEAAARGWVTTDPLRLQQILANLLGNAVKFTDAGEVVLSCRRQADGDHVFEVRDTGVGFPPEKAEALFRRYEQADGSISSRFGGTGLGLAISRRLAELLGGSLSATGEPGRGAVFRLALPLAPAAKAEAAPAAAPVPAAQDRALRILAADDHPTNRKLLEILLSPLEGVLQLAQDGADAVAAFREGDGEIDLVLMDLRMPKVDGLSAIRAIRRLEAEAGWRPAAVIALSAEALDEQQDASRAAGADRHVTKPINAGLLMAAIDEVLAGHRSAAAA